jgi:hypothetical protein
VLVGVDFDNTIVCYDAVFHRIAVDEGLIPPELPASKGQVRDYLRGCGREDAWTELQGQVYGARMREAPPFAGVRGFFSRCKTRGIGVCIISHKTLHPFAGPRHDLHRAAYDWLEHHGFFRHEQTGLSPGQVFFELTKQGKFDRIVHQGCGFFIDDLPELLEDPGFPAGPRRVLFDPGGTGAIRPPGQRAASWPEIERIVLCGQ